eukprot:161648_1
MCSKQSQDPTKNGAKRILAELMKSKFINQKKCNPMEKSPMIITNTDKYNNGVNCNGKNIENGIEKIIKYGQNKTKQKFNDKSSTCIQIQMKTIKKQSKNGNEYILNDNIQNYGVKPIYQYNNVHVELIQLYYTNDGNLKNKYKNVNIKKINM